MTEIKIINQPLTGSVGQQLEHLLSRESDRFDTARMAVAFAKKSGVGKIEKALDTFISRGGTITAVIGIDHKGTSHQALELLLDLGVEVYVFHEHGSSRTFHPKLYLLEREGLEGVALVGSNNLTYGGLCGNYELGTRIDHNLEIEDDRSLFQEMAKSIGWFAQQGTLLDQKTLLTLKDEGCLLNEERSSHNRDSTQGARSKVLASLFPQKRLPEQGDLQARRPAKPQPERTAQTFVIPLTESDVRDMGARSVITIPRTARDYDGTFWGWKSLFSQRQRNDQFWERNVKLLFTAADGSTHAKEKVRIEDFQPPLGGAFRICSEGLIDGAAAGDLLVMAPRPRGSDFHFEAAIIPQSHSLFNKYRELCNRRIPNSNRRWGYSEKAPRIPESDYYRQPTMML